MIGAPPNILAVQIQQRLRRLQNIGGSHDLRTLAATTTPSNAQGYRVATRRVITPCPAKISRTLATSSARGTSILARASLSIPQPSRFSAILRPEDQVLDLDTTTLFCHFVRSGDHRHAGLSRLSAYFSWLPKFLGIAQGTLRRGCPHWRSSATIALVVRHADRGPSRSRSTGPAVFGLHPALGLQRCQQAVHAYRHMPVAGTSWPVNRLTRSS